MIRRGDWVPLLPQGARLGVVTAVPVEPILRGLDYVLPGSEDSQQLSFIERAMPLDAWGALCLATGLIALVGLVGRWRRVASTGLWLGGSVYGALALGQWIAVAGQPWLDGIRGPAIVTLLAVAQLGMGAGYALQPDEADVAREVDHG
ncbi:hypothetical protein [Gordonia sp. (in: high G+C Gram-positive bacteria)]|uniref:hypothetical protein n=1 Tax=Gordonia sp. (in: high G+C Gram-positive bacteria) TaxID=84139 RepID=UPI00334207AB